MKKYFILLVIIFGFISLNAQIATAPIFGDGSVGNPYQIASLNNLYWIYADNTRWSLHYLQTDDIDATSTSTWYSGGASVGNTGWYPIGSNSINFSGSYNGHNYNISDIYTSRYEYGGLFGRISSTALITNVNVVNIEVNSDAYYGAGLVGWNNGGTITNCSCSGTISGRRQSGGLVSYNNGGTITDSYSTADVTPKNDGGGTLEAGGFIHSNAQGGIIDGCYSTGTVTGWNSGGFAYSNDYLSTIKNSHSSGNINGWTYSGGFIGRNAKIIDACYSTGDVAGGGEYIGGFVGEATGGTSVITNCYSFGDITRSSGSSAWEYGAFVGRANGTYTNCYTIGSVYYIDATDPTEKGFAGRRMGGTYDNNFWDNGASNQDYDNPDHDAATPIITALPKTTAEMKEPLTFIVAGWDFLDETVNGTDDYWGHNISNNDGYPFLDWQGFTNIFPEINLKQSITDISSGDSYNYRYVIVGNNSDIIFTIENIGAANLAVPTSLSITGTNMDQFSIQENPTTPVTPMGTTTFIVRFLPTSAGAKIAAISIANNDWNENPYILNLNGRGRECSDGSIIYNSESNTFNFCEDGVWVEK